MLPNLKIVRPCTLVADVVDGKVTICFRYRELSVDFIAYVGMADELELIMWIDEAGPHIASSTDGSDFGIDDV